MVQVQSQRTLEEPTVVIGTGIHTGEKARVTLHPVPSGSGITFRSQGETIPAHHACVVDTSRCTVLGKNGVTVSTVEHLLSACAGTGITDLLVEVQGPEMPIGDGSARIWLDAFAEAGIAQGDPTELLFPTALSQTVTVADARREIFLAARPAPEFRLLTHIAFEHSLIQTQTWEWSASHGNYAGEIAPARTFGFIEEVEALQKAGLAKGGTLENAVVIYPDRYSSPLRFDNELVRHKALDLLGDLLLVGNGLLPNADIIAIKPGHRYNVMLAAEIARFAQKG
ncbi:MAG: UDP-3-O-acyl-N-acetylglucosamine deacetylase [Armatimonadaceae bacterium]